MSQPATPQPAVLLSIDPELNLKRYTHIYFLGIGGIGMSALARWFLANGYVVAGYDKTSTPLTQALEAEGMEINYQDVLSAMPDWIKTWSDKILVVLTPAIPTDHQQWNWLLAKEFRIFKRAKVLGLIASGHKTIGIAGTHGKTTTSTMLAHLLKSGGVATTAFMGGIARNYNTNLLLSTKPATETWLVAEADEFDRSFLHLYPQITVLTSTDADHLDIYGHADDLLETFGLFVGQIQVGGTVYTRKGITTVVPSHAKHHEFDLASAEICAQDLKVHNDCFSFDAKLHNQLVPGIVLQMPGYHNVANALAAAAVASEIGLNADQIREGLNSFKGVGRRFEFVKQTGATTFIDDYAHHPTEIEAFLSSVKAMYPNKRVTAIFQPHLYSRTRDFLMGFAQALGLADEVILLDIYPAREQPIPGVTSERLLELIPIQNKLLLPKQRLVGYLANHPVEVICTIGAGDIDAMVQSIAQVLR